MNLGKWIGLMALIVSLYILWEIRQVLLLVFTAVVLASALNGIVRQMTKRGIERGIAVLLAVFLFLGIATGFGLLIIPPFIVQFQEFAELVPKSLDRVQIWLDWIATQIPGETIEDIDIVDNLTEQIPIVASQLFRNFFALFSNSLVVLLNILLIVVLTIMMLAEPSKYRHLFIKLFPAFYRRRVDQILHQCNSAIDNWIVGILFNMIVIGVCSGIGLWALGVKLVLANALLAGLLEAIPNIGPTLSVIPPMAIALLDSPWKVGAVLILYVLIQQMEQYFLVPTVMAKQLALPPAITLLSQIIFALFFGFLGLLLALPLVIVAQIWLREVLIKDILDQWDRKTLDAVQRQKTTVETLGATSAMDSFTVTPESQESS